MNDGGPAFPTDELRSYGSYMGVGEKRGGGMSLRHWFAGKALQGMLASGEAANIELRAQRCYEYADAMIEAAKQTPQEGKADSQKSAMQRFRDMCESFSEHESDGNMYSKLRSLYFEVAQELDALRATPPAATDGLTQQPIAPQSGNAA